MYSKLREINEELWDISSSEIPDFVKNYEIQKKGIMVGDYKPTIDRKTGVLGIKFSFIKDANWDLQKSKQLEAVVAGFPRYEVVSATGKPILVNSICESSELTKDAVYNNYLIFDRKGYETAVSSNSKVGFEKVYDIISAEKYIPNSYRSNFAGMPPAKTKEEAESVLSERIAAMIDSKSITTTWYLFEDVPELIEEIGSKFFGARLD